jgi:small subunit ribosomal protein S17
MARRRLIGTITSVKMTETALVTSEVMRRHPLYGKRFRRTTTFAAHNPANTYGVGDLVEIEEHRPISKTKHFLIRRLVTAAPKKVGEIAEDSEILAETKPAQSSEAEPAHKEETTAEAV